MDLPELVRQAQNGNTQAFGQLYDVFSQRIFRFIRVKVQQQQQAEDILQDVFIKAWQALPKFKLEGGNFSAWLYRIAANAMNDQFRRQSRRPLTVEITVATDLSGESVLENAQQQGDREAVKAALAKLSPPHREILELRFIQGFSCRETAEICGRTNLAIRLIQYRALKELRAILE